MAKIKAERYLYASARVRAMENGIFSSSQADALLEARNPGEMLKILAAAGYDTQDADPEDPAFYEKLLSDKRGEVLRDVAEMAPEEGLFDFFLYLYDYHNIKVLLKGEILNQESDRLLMDAGTIRPDQMKKAVQERSATILTEEMLKGIQAAVEAYAVNQNSQMIDIVLDRYCFADMLRCARRTGSEFVVGYVRRQIDLANLKAFLRLRKIEASQELASQVFLPDGTISREQLLRLFSQPISAAAEEFDIYPVGELFRKGVELCQKTGGIAELERLCDNDLMDYVRGAKYVSYGVEPLVGYLFAKENEFKSLKIILAGKMAGLTPERIRERLRESYV